MAFCTLLLLLIIIKSATLSKKGEFNTDYISKDGTTPIKGIFVVLILFSHAKGYFASLISPIYDAPYVALQMHLGQMIVAMFLFYSGYGIMEQIKKREFTYVKSIPSKRFLNLLLNYDISVVLFLILALCVGTPLKPLDILLSFIAWTGVGNSSWFIFITFCLYFITFLSFFSIKWKNNQKYYYINIIILTALSVGLMFLLKFAGKERWWYNTELLFALGFWYSYLKKPIEKFIMKSDLSYFTSFFAFTIIYVLAYLHRGDAEYMYLVYGFVFALFIVLITMKVKLESRMLNWFGDHVFSIYILQRIPMIALSKMGLNVQHKYIFLILSIAITCLMAEYYDRLYAKLSSIIWKPKKSVQNI